MSQYPNFNNVDNRSLKYQEEDLNGNDVMDDTVPTEFQHRQQQVQMYYDRDAMDQSNIPPHMYGGPQFGSAQEQEQEMWRKHQQQSYMHAGQMQQGYQGNLHQHGMADGHYYHQFQNMNPSDSYQPYLHRPNHQDPEVAQAMLNLGNDRDGNHRHASNDPAAHFFPPPPQYYYHPMDMQHMGHAQDPGTYYPTVHPREPQMYPPHDQGDRQTHVPPQQHPIAIDKKRKRPSDMPRRPLSAYNFFFSEERERILAELSGEDKKEGQKVGDADTNGKKEDQPQDNEKNADVSPTDAAKETNNLDIKTSPSKAVLEPPTSESETPVSSKSDAQDAIPISSKGEKKSDTEQKSEIDTSAEKSEDVDPDSCGERLLSQRWEDSKKRRPHRKSHGMIAFKDLAKLIGQRWHNISETQKKKYNNLAEKDLERYTEQMKVYNAKRAAKKMEDVAGTKFSSSSAQFPPNMMHQYGMSGHPQMMMHNQMISNPKEQIMGRQNETAPTSNDQETKS